MPELLATPRFGGPRNIPEFYETINKTVLRMRGKATLRAICTQLEAEGHKTATGLNWTRTRLANYIHNSASLHEQT